MQPRWTWHHWALGGLVVFAGLSATNLAARACSLGDDPPRLLGLWLGATPDDVRARFAGTHFRSEVGEDVALIADGSLTVAPGARFEFHDGQLVAVRLTLDPAAPDAAGDRLVVTPQTVLARSSRPDGSVAVVLLSRTCPTHRDEAERLVSSETPDLP